jgi:hypothetical protein
VIFDIQTIAIVGSIAFLVLIVNDLRTRRLQPQYSILWLVLGTGTLVVSVWRHGLEVLAHLLRIYYPPAALFVVLFLVLFLLAHHFSREASRANQALRAVIQDCALIRLELDELRRERAGVSAAPLANRAD